MRYSTWRAARTRQHFRDEAAALDEQFERECRRYD